MGKSLSSISSARKEDLNRIKNWFKKMIEFTKTNSLNFLFLFILGYVIWLVPELCLSADCNIFNIKNIVWIGFTILYFILIIDERTEDDIKILTKYKLMQDLGLKINKKEINKKLKK